MPIKSRWGSSAFETKARSAASAMTRREALALFAAALATPALIRNARAATYPERAITCIVPFGPGGPNDVMARVIAGPVSEVLGQTFVVENRAGAGGN